MEELNTEVLPLHITVGPQSSPVARMLTEREPDNPRAANCRAWRLEGAKGTGYTLL